MTGSMIEESVTRGSTITSHPPGPGPGQRQQMHLDVSVNDLDDAVARAIELGAREADHRCDSCHHIRSTCEPVCPSGAATSNVCWEQSALDTATAAVPQALLERRSRA
jgi:hypothetical protein